MAEPFYELEVVADNEGTLTILAQIAKFKGELSDDGRWLKPAHVTSMSYTIRNLSTGEVVEGHENVDITPSDVLFAELVTNEPLWTKDTTGFNFKFQPEVETGDDDEELLPFPDAGELYLLKIKYRCVGSSTPYIIRAKVETPSV